MRFSNLGSVPVLVAVLSGCATADRQGDEPAPSVVAIDLAPGTTAPPASASLEPEPRSVEPARGAATGARPVAIEKGPVPPAPSPAITAAPAPTVSSGPTQPSAPQPSPAALQQARTLFSEGVMRFEQGDVHGARMSFEAAFRTAPNPAVLFNIGQCFLAEGNTRAACATFQRFLDESPPRVGKNRRPGLLAKCPGLR